VKRKAILTVLFLIVLGTIGCKRQSENLNVCPIDGAAPQWMGRRNGNSCEYLHHNDVERQTHSWWADCKLAIPEKPKEK
jgi:hypothetical protein